MGDLSIENREAEWLDLDLLPNSLFDVWLAFEPSIEFGPARKFSKDYRADHPPRLVEDGSRRAEFTPLHHRLYAVEVSRPDGLPACWSPLIAAVVSEHEILCHLLSP